MTELILSNRLLNFMPLGISLDGIISEGTSNYYITVIMSIWQPLASFQLRFFIFFLFSIYFAT